MSSVLAVQTVHVNGCLPVQVRVYLRDDLSSFLMTARNVTREPRAPHTLTEYRRLPRVVCTWKRLYDNASAEGAAIRTATTTDTLAAKALMW
jgi:hypothetical protein